MLILTNSTLIIKNRLPKALKNFTAKITQNTHTTIYQLIKQHTNTH